jgi:hypothetical protein
VTVVCDSRSLGWCLKRVLETGVSSIVLETGVSNAFETVVSSLLLYGDLRRPQLPSMKTGSVGVWIARVQWLSLNVRWLPERPSNPSYPRFRGIVHQFVSTPVELSGPRKDHDSSTGVGYGPAGS